jgi:EpsD family peptidyl-prolyl cis-trans isomerase
MLALAVAAGCNKSDDKQAATQVAAKVEADEITVHQVNAVLARAPTLTPDEAARAKQEILNRLIDQQLAVQQAVRRKLDRSPSVVQSIEAARLDILARAYADDVARSLPKPSVEDVRKYYSDHPELFAQRRIYSLEEISLASKEGLAASLREQVAKARSMQEIGAWLRGQGIPFSENRSARPAEQFAMDTLARLVPMKEGEMRVFESPGALSVIRVAAAQTVPIDEATASQRIQQFLFNRRLSEAVNKEMKQVKGAAKIQYFGEFAGAEGAKPGGGADPVPAQAPAAPKAKTDG